MIYTLKLFNVWFHFWHNQRLRSLLRNKTLKQNINTEILTEENVNKSWFTIPFVLNISDKFKNIIKDLNIKFFSLNNIIKTHKDPLPNKAKKNVVYKIYCKDCDVSYIGQTGRTLKTRISEYRNDIRRNTQNHTVITEYRLDHNHNFDWKNT